MTRGPSHRGKIVSEAEFARLWHSGARLIDMADALGISPQAVRYRAEARSLGPRVPCGREVITCPAFATLWAAGVRGKDIAVHYGVSHLTPRNTAARLGLEPRPRWNKSCGISMAEYRQAQIVSAMMAEAKITRAAMRDAEMIDGVPCINTSRRKAA